MSRGPIDPRSQSGVALIMVLLIIAILSILVLEFHFNARVNFAIANNIADDLRANYLALSGMNVAGKFLVEDYNDNKYDHLNEDWAMPLPPIPIGDGMVTVQIVDENSKLNLNRLVRTSGSINKRTQDQLAALFVSLDIDPALVNPIIDWIDPNDQDVVSGVYEDSAYGYSQMTPSVQPRNGPMSSLSELRQVAGFNDEIFSKVEPYVTIFGGSRININTAPVEVLAALIESIEPGTSGDWADVIVESRAEKPFKKKNIRRDLKRLGLPSNLARQLNKACTVKTRTFNIKVIATTNETTKVLNAVLVRQKDRVDLVYLRTI
ncbi:MAG: type II secretion system minor pseudopilin GspK [Candidatus Alcyoniella australis]|nr:type II secretion system minor pseudopilin GspK [Candidatus Alcyoniella australis]